MPSDLQAASGPVPRPAPASVDVLVIGAGPVGLAVAIEVQRRGLTVAVVDKGALVNSLVGYPTNMEFFSTPDLLEIGDYPFPTFGHKPLREEALDYYRRVAERERLDLRLGTRITALDGHAGDFRARADTATGAVEIAARAVVVATGFFDTPVRIGVTGEDLPHVGHYFKEPYGHAATDVLVVGAKNSAAKAALALHRAGARVTLAVRGDALSPSIKYWIRPDLENRIAEGSIRALFGTTVAAIRTGEADLTTPVGPVTVAANAVYLLTGYVPDYPLLSTLGVPVGDDPARTPVYDEATMESGRAGVYLAGTVCGGLRTSRWFIENGRVHATLIAADLAAQRAESGYRPVGLPEAAASVTA